MATFWESLSEQGKVNWAKLYKRLKRKKWEIPTNKAIQCETKMESLEEISRFIREVPNPTRRE